MWGLKYTQQDLLWAVWRPAVQFLTLSTGPLGTSPKALFFERAPHSVCMRRRKETYQKKGFGLASSSAGVHELLRALETSLQIRAGEFSIRKMSAV